MSARRASSHSRPAAVPMPVVPGTKAEFPPPPQPLAVAEHESETVHVVGTSPFMPPPDDLTGEAAFDKYIHRRATGESRPTRPPPKPASTKPAGSSLTAPSIPVPSLPPAANADNSQARREPGHEATEFRRPTGQSNMLANPMYASSVGPAAAAGNGYAAANEASLEFARPKTFSESSRAGVYTQGGRTVQVFEIAEGDPDLQPGNKADDHEAYHKEDHHFHKRRCLLIVVLVLLLGGAAAAIVISLTASSGGDSAQLQSKDEFFVDGPVELMMDKEPVTAKEFVAVNLGNYDGEDVSKLKGSFAGLPTTFHASGDGSEKLGFFQVPDSPTLVDGQNCTLLVRDPANNQLIGRATYVYAAPPALLDDAAAVKSVETTYADMGEYLGEDKASTLKLFADATADDKAALTALYDDLARSLLLLQQKMALADRRRGAPHARAAGDGGGAGELVRLIFRQPWFFRARDVRPLEHTPSVPPNGRSRSWVERLCDGVEPGWRYFELIMSKCESEYEKYLRMQELGLLPVLTRDDVELLFRISAVQQLGRAKALYAEFSTCVRHTYRLVPGMFAPDFDQDNSLSITIKAGVPEEFSLVTHLRSLVFRDATGEPADLVALGMVAVEAVAPAPLLILNNRAGLPDALQVRRPVVPRANLRQLEYPANPARIDDDLTYNNQALVSCELTKPDSPNGLFSLLCTLRDTTMEEATFDFALGYRYMEDTASTPAVRARLVIPELLLDHSCSSPETNRCHKFATCIQLPDGHECECLRGYGGTGTVCTEVDFCTAGSKAPCHPDAVCVNNPNNKEGENLHLCTCKTGYVGTGSNYDSIGCRDINECDEGTADCPANTACQNLPGTFSCPCAPGYHANAETGACEDINECLVKGCPVNTVCENLPGSFKCTCAPGFEVDAPEHLLTRGCRNIDECFEDNASHECSEERNERCVDTDGSYSCVCDWRFYQVDGEGPCVPEIYIEPDEMGEAHCAAGTHKCVEHSWCATTPPTYECVCNKGYQGDGLIKCDPVDECADGSHQCPVQSTCIDIADPDAARAAGRDETWPPGYDCECPERTYWDNWRTCVSPNECELAQDDCPRLDQGKGFSRCVDQFIGWSCECVTGYRDVGVTADGRSCEDINECVELTHDCADFATCTNTVGGHECACNSGFQGYPTIGCYDVDECKEGGTHDCPENSTCQNQHGYFSCWCNRGYAFTDDLTACNDVNECLDNYGGCKKESQYCRNLPGSHECVCRTGWIDETPDDDSDPLKCVDNDKCSDDDCPPNEFSGALLVCFEAPGPNLCACDESQGWVAYPSSDQCKKQEVEQDCNKEGGWVDRTLWGSPIHSAKGDPAATHPKFALDADTGTYWKGDSKTDQWFSVDMKTINVFDKVRVTRRNMRAKNVKVIAANDFSLVWNQLLGSVTFSDDQNERSLVTEVRDFYDPSKPVRASMFGIHVVDVWSGYTGLEEVEVHGFTCGEPPEDVPFAAPGDFSKVWKQELWIEGVDAGLEAPDGMNIHKDGRVIVCNEAGENVIAFDMDTKKGEKIASRSLSAPEEVAMDLNSGALYVSDDKEKAVFMFAEAGAKPSKLMDEGDGLTSPEGIAVAADGTVYVSDERARQVWKVKKGGKPEVIATEDDGIYAPEGMSIASDGTVYITDDEKGGVIRISPDDKVDKFLMPTDVELPEAVFVDKDDNVWFTNNDPRSNHATVMKFSKEGRRLDRIVTKVPTGKISGIAVLPDGRVAFGASFFISGDRTDQIWLLTALDEEE